jgi:hypothetical protein
MSNTIRHHSYLAEVAVGAFLIVRHGTADGACTLATAATDAILGASDALPKAVGEMVDVAIGEFGEVTTGAAVTRGAALTANAASKAVPTTTAGNRIIGFAEQSAAGADQVIRYRVAPGVL